MATEHTLDFGKIFESGVMTAGDQFVQIWCNQHGRYEWHWVPNTAEHAGFSTYDSSAIESLNSRDGVPGQS